MAFEIYIPENLKFSDYIAVLQTTRTWADGYDRKVGQKPPPPSTPLPQQELQLTRITGYRKALSLAGQLCHC